MKNSFPTGTLTICKKTEILISQMCSMRPLRIYLREEPIPTGKEK